MENITEDDVSSMANHSSFSGSSAAASGESGWTTYIDYFMETQQQQHKEGSGACSAASSTDDMERSTPEHIGGHGGADGAVATFSEAARLLGAQGDPSQVPKRLMSFRKEGIRRKKLMHDESLEDTATSPISIPRLIDSRDSNGKYKKKEDGCDEVSHYKKTSEELDCDNHTINDDGAKPRISDDASGHNELRKKGLCLVPVTVFHVCSPN